MAHGIPDISIHCLGEPGALHKRSRCPFGRATKGRAWRASLATAPKRVACHQKTPSYLVWVSCVGRRTQCPPRRRRSPRRGFRPASWLWGCVAWNRQKFCHGFCHGYPDVGTHLYPSVGFARGTRQEAWTRKKKSPRAFSLPAWAFRWSFQTCYRSAYFRPRSLERVVT